MLGDLLSPRLLIQEGAQLNGNVSTKPNASATSTASPTASAPKNLGPVSHQKTA